MRNGLSWVGLGQVWSAAVVVYVAVKVAVVVVAIVTVVEVVEIFCSNFGRERQRHWFHYYIVVRYENKGGRSVSK